MCINISRYVPYLKMTPFLKQSIYDDYTEKYKKCFIYNLLFKINTFSIQFLKRFKPPFRKFLITG